MPFTPIAPQVYELSLGPANQWLVEDRDGLTLIDTNYAGKEQAILTAVEKLGKKQADIHQILITHCHPDHAGSLAALKQITGAQVWMHPADANVVRGRGAMGRSQVSPGLQNAILFQLFIKNVAGQVPVAQIDHEIQDGDTLPCGGGIKAIHTPGHSAGHMAFLLPQGGGILLIGDACSNMVGLDYSIVYDDIQEARRSLAKLAQINCAAVCFSHGKALKGAAVQKFRNKWAG